MPTQRKDHSSIPLFRSTEKSANYPITKEGRGVSDPSPTSTSAEATIVQAPSNNNATLSSPIVYFMLHLRHLACTIDVRIHIVNHRICFHAPRRACWRFARLYTPFKEALGPCARRRFRLRCNAGKKFMNNSRSHLNLFRANPGYLQIDRAHQISHPKDLD